MLLCEFCDQFQKDGTCRLGLDLPKRMTCRMFDPSVGSFCSDPGDFVNAAQLSQMAVFFGIKGPELKKIKLMATREVEGRSKVLPALEAETQLEGPSLPPNSTNST
jgi:hypothetical protein